MAFLHEKRRTKVRREAQIQNRTMGLFNFVVVLAVGAVAYTDWKVEANVSLGYLYVLPLALSAIVNPLSVTIGLALLCTALMDLFGPPAETMTLRVAHSAVGLAGFLVVGF